MTLHGAVDEILALGFVPPGKALECLALHYKSQALSHGIPMEHTG